MFSYYGSKSKIVHLYPRPKFDTVIEPFAGSARYSLRYFEKDVILIDKYSVIIDIWKYLQNASEQDILGLPHLQRGEAISDYNLAQCEKDFLGFLVCGGVESPRDNVASFKGVNVAKDLKYIAKCLFKIRHWKLINGEYDCLDNIEATWFIDPPYFQGGQSYKCPVKDIDFAKLAAFAQSRNGQVMVCENSAASWMPFRHLKQMQGRVKSTTEVWWTNEHEPTQESLF